MQARLLARLLVGALTLWVMVLPIAPALHFVAASHAHHYCNEHQRVEEMPQSIVATASTTPTDSAQTAYVSVQEFAPEFAYLHVSCLFWNVLTQRGLTPTHTPASTPTLTRLPAAPPTGLPAAQPLLVLLQAPKQSPPAACTSLS